MPAPDADVLKTAAAVASSGVPVLVMTYWNPVERHGVDRFARALPTRGGRRLITPDLIPDEAAPDRRQRRVRARPRLPGIAELHGRPDRCGRRSLARVFWMRPRSRWRLGPGPDHGAQAPELVARVRTLTDQPVGVGLGVSTGPRAAEVAGYADGVIVGSAFVRCLLDAPDEARGVAAVAALAADLARGVRNPRRTDGEPAVASRGLSPRHRYREECRR